MHGTSFSPFSICNLFFPFFFFLFLFRPFGFLRCIYLCICPRLVTILCFCKLCPGIYSYSSSSYYLETGFDFYRQSFDNFFLRQSSFVCTDLKSDLAFPRAGSYYYYCVVVFEFVFVVILLPRVFHFFLNFFVLFKASI
jgi:hypothetical protein